MDSALYRIEKQADGGYAIKRKEGQIFKAKREPTVADPFAETKANIAELERYLQKNAAFRGAPIYQLWVDSLEKEKAKLPEGVMVEKAEASSIPVSPITQIPAEKPTLVKSVIPPIAGSKPKSTAQNLVTRARELGGIRFGDSYNTKELRQFPDLAAVSNQKTGNAPDEIAAMLNEEGFDVGTADDFIELLKTGRARKLYVPEKRDELIERDLRRMENEWAERELERYREQEGIDAEAIKQSQSILKTALLTRLEREGLLTPQKKAQH